MLNPPRICTLAVCALLFACCGGSQTSVHSVPLNAADPAGLQCWVVGGGQTTCLDRILDPGMTGATGSWTGAVSTWRERTPRPAYTLAAVRASRAPLSSSALAPSSYMAAAARVGVMSAATDEAMLLEVLHGLNLKVYDYDKVDGYLSHEAAKVGKYAQWIWKPARQVDEKAVLAAQVDRSVVSSDSYQKEIPLCILQEMATLLGKMPGALLLVSDYEMRKPDPFLAITTTKLAREGKFWVIDQWDEPGFTSPAGSSSCASALTTPTV